MDSSNFPLIILLDVVIGVIVGYPAYALWRGRNADWFKKTPLFYWIAFFVCLSTIIATITTTFFHAQPQESQDIIMLNTPLSVGLAKAVYVSFYLAAFGIIFAGVKSIREKQSITPGVSPAFWKQVSGYSAQISGIVYLVIGLAFVIFLLWISPFFWSREPQPKNTLQDVLNSGNSIIESF